MRRHRSAVLLAVFVVVCLPACTGAVEPAADTPMSTPPSTTAAAPRAEQVWSLDLPIIGEPEPADDVAVVYSTAGGELFLNGIDAATGAKLWTRQAHPGEVVTGIAITPEVVDITTGDPAVAYFRPATPPGRLRAELVVADPDTGADLAATSTLLLGSPPEPCFDDRDVCVQARDTPNDTRYEQRRLRLTDGRLVTEPPPTPNFRLNIGPAGLSIVGDQQREFLARIDGTGLRWQRPVEDLFGPGYSFSGGWGFTEFPEQNLAVGYIGTNDSESPEGEPVDDDLTRYRTAAIDLDDGELLWRTDATLPYCGFALPGDLNDDTAGGPYPLRCRYSGALRYPPARGDPTPINLAVTIEGYDPATGDTTWSLPMGEEPRLAYAGGIGATAAPGQILLPTPEGPRIVDVLDGTIRPAAEAGIFGCATEDVTFDYNEPYYTPDGEPLTERRGGRLTVACDASAAPINDPLPASVVQAVGLHIGDTYIVATDAQLVGYQLTT